MLRSSIRRGYTLIELLVVITVLGIAAALVTPSMSSTGSLRVQAAVRTLVSDITFAQSDALAFQTGRALMFYPNTSSYKMVEVRGATLDPVADLIQETRLGDAKYGDAAIHSVSLVGQNASCLIFDEMGAPVTAPGGTTPAGNGTVVIEGSGQRFTLTVEGFTGRVSVLREDIIPGGN